MANRRTRIIQWRLPAIQLQPLAAIVDGKNVCACVCVHVCVCGRDGGWQLRCMLSCFSCVWLFGTPWIVATSRFLCPWDSPGKNTGVVAIPFSRGSSQPRDWTHISSIGRRFFTTRDTWEAGKGLDHQCIYGSRQAGAEIVRMNNLTPTWLCPGSLQEMPWFKQGHFRAAKS